MLAKGGAGCGVWEVEGVRTPLGPATCTHTHRWKNRGWLGAHLHRHVLTTALHVARRGQAQGGPQE
jgi:hypothetical protein